MKIPLSKYVLLAGLVTGAIASVELPYPNEATHQLLIEASKDEDRVQRVRTVRALVDAKDDRNAAALARAAQDPVEAVRHEATRVPPVVQGTPPGTFAPRPSISAAEAGETHRDPRVRQTARLRLLDAAEYQADFSKLLDDPDYFVRRAVSSQVVKARGAPSLSIWRKLLVSDKLDDRIEAAWAVGQLDSKTDEATLLGFISSDSERLQLVSIESLKLIGGDGARSAIGDLIVKHSGKTQEALLRLATDLQAHGALPVLRELAANDKAAMGVRLLALDGIGVMADAEAKPMLLKMVENYVSRTDLREHAARALGTVGGPEAIPPIAKLLTEKVIFLPIGNAPPIHDSESTRNACLLALEQLKANDILKSLPTGKASSVEGFTEVMRRNLAEILTRITGTAYDYRRDAPRFRDVPIQSLTPKEYPPDVLVGMKKPDVFVK